MPPSTLWDCGGIKQSSEDAENLLAPLLGCPHITTAITYVASSMCQALLEFPVRLNSFFPRNTVNKQVLL